MATRRRHTLDRVKTPHLNATAVAAIRSALSTSPVTHADIAQALGVSPDTVRRRLAGESDLTLTEVELIAEVLDTSPAVLLGFSPVGVSVDAGQNVGRHVDVQIDL